MASTQIYFNYPTYSKHTLDLYSYCDDSYSSEDDYSDYENDIEYSLQQQDKLERYIGIGSGRASGGSLSTSPSSKSTKATSNSSVSGTLSTPTIKQSKSTSVNTKSSNDVKSVEEILNEIEQQKQESKHKTPEVEKTIRLTSTQVNEILQRETESNKKERLPSTSEVYNRIKWEFNDKIDNFTILYEDRFDGLISTPYKEFEYDVIPHHRIQAFKYLDNTIYSRKDRIYNFNQVYNN